MKTILIVALLTIGIGTTAQAQCLNCQPQAQQYPQYRMVPGPMVPGPPMMVPGPPVQQQLQGVQQMPYRMGWFPGKRFGMALRGAFSPAPIRYQSVPIYGPMQQPQGTQ